MNDLPYQRGAHALIETGAEQSVDLPLLAGELPPELRGVYARNSGNPRYQPPGKYHWFDGDGLVHSVQLEAGQARYTSRYVRTSAASLEDEAGRALWGGLLEPLDPRHPHGPLKDTANTDVVWHAGRLLCLWWLTGTPYELELPSLETRGPAAFAEGTRGVAAHPKVCPRTGELAFFGYDLTRRPYYWYGLVDAQGTRTHLQEIDLPHAHVPHDIAITERYSILLDLPLGYERAALARGERRIGFDRDLPGRIGVLPRAGGPVRWFEVDPCYVYHTVNAHEEGETLVLTACRIEDPLPAKRPGPEVTRLDRLSLVPHLYRWRIDLERGEVRGERLDDRPTEFPRAHDGFATRALRYSYHPRLAPRADLLFDGLIKYDLLSGGSVSYDLPPGRFLSEPVFAPRHEGSLAPEHEDAGWLVTLVSDEGGGAAELWVFDARELPAGPLARAALPGHVPPGFHAAWIPGSELAVR